MTRNINVIVPTETYEQIQSIIPNASIGDISLQLIGYGMKYLAEQKQKENKDKK